MTSVDQPAAGWRQSGLAWILVTLLVMWGVEVIDATALSDRLEQQGIMPRELGGLDGILWAPFLHGSFGHLASNTLPFAILGGLVALRGLRRWVSATVLILVVSGGATWLLARSGNRR